MLYRKYVVSSVVLLGKESRFGLAIHDDREGLSKVPPCLE